MSAFRSPLQGQGAEMPAFGSFQLRKGWYLCPSPASPLAAPPRPPWASPPTTPTPSAVSSKTGGRSKGGIGGGYRARGIRPPLGFQPAAAAASFSFKLSQLLRSSFSSLEPSPFRQGEGKRKSKRALSCMSLRAQRGNLVFLILEKLFYAVISIKWKQSKNRFFSRGKTFKFKNRYQTTFFDF